MSEKRYVILELSDAKLIAERLRDHSPMDAQPWPFIERLLAETGADIEDIVRQLKQLEFCPACVIEGQQGSCNCLTANKLGRRLSRLVDRANAQHADGV